MKQTYTRPSTEVMRIEVSQTILQGSKIYTDDPQNPENALVKESGFIWDEDKGW